jgi:hypothetical protein
MTPLDWSVDPRDWSRPGVAALKIVLPRLLDAGYHFTTP